jgi:tRNA nucleotidyltransferase (CCA-adding enzyme)
MPLPAELPIPDNVRRIAEKLEAAGFDTWCVGGAIRDNLLNLPNSDFDLATAARPEDVQRLFKRTIPVGVDHGTVAVLDRNRKPHEVTTFRRDVSTDGRHAVVAFGVAIEEDLARRDFTINAIAYHPIRHEWRDPFDGEGDLERKVIRAVGDPSERFREDYLRILRALRFAARLGFEIEPATWEAAKAHVEGLRQLSAERVRDEWFKGLTTAVRARELVRLWGEVGAVERWLPEFGEAGRGKGEAVDEGSAVVGRGGRREEGGVDRLPRDPVLITAFLSADPPVTLDRLKCSRAEIERGARIGEWRGREPSGEDPVEVRRWLSQVGEAADDLNAMAAVEGRAARLATAVKAVRASGAPLTISNLAIDGNDLKKLGIAPGPWMGEILRRLLEEALQNPAVNTSPALLARARDLASERTPPSHTPPSGGEQGGGRREGE